MTNQPPPVGTRSPLPTCIGIFDHFWYCASPVSQLSQYYRHGDIEDCSILLSDWSKCMQTLVVKDEEKKYAIMANTSVMIPKVENRIWEYKETPGWTMENSKEIETGKKKKSTWFGGSS